MKITVEINDVNEYNKVNHQKSLHPLVSIIDFSKAPARDWGEVESFLFKYGLYCIYLKDVKCGDIKYGRHYYDYQAGTLVFFAPGQVSEIKRPPEPVKPMGYGLIFHPDFLIGTSLGRSIRNYKFFDYETFEALHLSEDERAWIVTSLNNIQSELLRPIDKHSKKLIAAGIELFLDYCQRFYDRQFITREVVNKSVLEKFENLLNEYFITDSPQTIGLPSVSYFAEKMNLSPNYFGDLIKKETGQSPKEYLQYKTIDFAKQIICESDKTINEIAYDLGFKYPQHFTRLFKQKVGYTPNEYRNLN